MKMILPFWQHGRTAMHLAAEKGKLLVVEALITAKADINLVDQVLAQCLE